MTARTGLDRTPLLLGHLCMAFLPVDRVKSALANHNSAILEELASQCESRNEISAVVEYLASELRKSGLNYRPKHPPLCVTMLAWLLVYRAIEPVLVLEAMLIINDFSALSICGTSHFAKDVLAYRKLDPRTGKAPQFEVKFTENLKVDTDLLNSLKSVSTSPENLAKPPQTSKLNDIRHILLGSVSASESVRKIEVNFVKNSEKLVVHTVFLITLEPKVYNRIMGNTMIQLLQDRRWLTAFVAEISLFFNETINSIQEVFRLKIFGLFLGHVLGAHPSLWPQVFPIFDLESGASARIVILKMLQELRAELGAPYVRKNVQQLPNIAGLTRSELADAFWEMAGLETMP